MNLPLHDRAQGDAFKSVTTSDSQAGDEQGKTAMQWVVVMTHDAATCPLECRSLIHTSACRYTLVLTQQQLYLYNAYFLQKRVLNPMSNSFPRAYLVASSYVGGTSSSLNSCSDTS